MVLSAGLGTRLRPLTDRRAKPLVPVGDRPALAHVLDHLQASGVQRIVVNAHHLADQVIAFVGAQTRAGGVLEVKVSVEAALLGTAGGIAHARALLGDGDLLVWNGDILAAGLDVRALTAFHDAVATLVVQPLGKGSAGQGSVGLDASGCVVRLRGERFGGETRGGQFLGISVLGAALRERLPRQAIPAGLVEDVLLPALARGEAVRAFEFEGLWHDIGTLESYRAANRAWLAARDLPTWVGAGAQIAGAVKLAGCVIGEAARIAGAGALERCVVWPGAHAVAPLRDEVVITRG